MIEIYQSEYWSNTVNDYYLLLTVEISKINSTAQLLLCECSMLENKIF